MENARLENDGPNNMARRKKTTRHRAKSGRRSMSALQPVQFFFQSCCLIRPSLASHRRSGRVPGIEAGECWRTMRRPTHGGRYCLGERKRYRLCNVDACPHGAPSFREHQCAAFNNKPYKGRRYVYEPVNTPGTVHQLEIPRSACTALLLYYLPFTAPLVFLC